ncbi:MAG: hypothetical protein J2P21_08385 [Chloracidobacterium sp.]|nr:hypothetical protein [Chloracidobacterium sp.]
MKKGEAFEVFVVDSALPDQEQYQSINFLEMAKKGSEGLDHETGENFKYATDSIILCIFEKAAISFVFESGKFRRIITADRFNGCAGLMRILHENPQLPVSQSLSTRRIRFDE